MKIRPRIYIIGAITPRKNKYPVIEYAENFQNFLRVGKELMAAGFAPFVGILDFPLAVIGADVLKQKDFYEASLSFLDACDACMVILNDKLSRSAGSAREIAYARKKRIPVFYDLAALKKYFYEKEIKDGQSN